ncbi:MAG: tetratricopeptide repeat protein [Leptospiraceae bacterium]|nr:tetratricopeptide repeat protein [Leptospiraceae bacterium]
MESREKTLDLIRRAEYSDAFRALRKELESKSISGERKGWLLYYACISLFGLGHIQQARKYYQELLEVSGDSVSTRYIRAYLEMQSRHPEEALVTLTSILELDPSDTRCDALIEQLKEEPERFADYSRKRAGILDFFPGLTPDPARRRSAGRQSDLQEDLSPGYSDDKRGKKSAGLGPIQWKSAADGDLREAYPDLADATAKGRRRWAWMGGLAVLALAGVAGMLYSGYSPIPLNLDDSDLPLPPGQSTVLPPEAGDFPFRYDSKEDAVAEYEKARAAIEDGRINQARKMLGRLERSNIDFIFRERARSLRQSIPLPSMDDFRDTITLAEINSDPFSYRDAVFLWPATVHKVMGDGPGLHLEVEAQDRTLTLSYSGTNEEKRKALRSLEAGDEIQVYGRILSSDEQGSRSSYQLLDFKK